MSDDLGYPSDAADRSIVWLTILGAAGGGAAIYFLSTERGRRWLRELPELGRGWAAAVRQGMALVREIAEQIEHSVESFEQTLGRVEKAIPAEDISSLKGGERA